MLPYTVRQGDQFMIPFIACVGNVQIAEGDIEDVEIVVGTIRKTWKNGEVKYNAERKTFDFPLLQEESYKFVPNTTLHSLIRAKLKTDKSIFSNTGPDIYVIASASKEII